MTSTRRCKFNFIPACQDSAKESRRKKAEYMAGVERRADERDQYKQRCDTLEKENAGLTQVSEYEMMYHRR